MAIQAVVLTAIQKTLLSELKRYWKTSDIWRSLLEYSGINDVKQLTDFITKGSFKGFETLRETKIYASDLVVELFETQVWESYKDYLRHTGWSEQKGGWLGLNEDLENGIRSYLDTFRSGGVVRYAKALLRWKNDPTYAKWEWSDWYITGEDIHQNNGFSDTMILDRFGFVKLEGIKAIWKKQNDR